MESAQPGTTPIDHHPITDLLFQAVAESRLGVVEHFDEAVGLGELLEDHGVTIGFHCTQIADGTRTIALGTRVTFDLVRSNLGAIEAAHIAPAS